MAKIFQETGRWNSILDVSTIGTLNEKVLNREIGELVRVNEALHHKNLARIADQIVEDERIKLVTIAGPSSSGKTTFSKRLYIHLRASGKNPIVISLDNYYIGRKNVPLDEHGNGPSSSGKTTFSKRLYIHLRASGKNPIVISLDNYYIGRKNVPLDEHGNKDYETIEALDLKLLNENLTDLIAGKEVEIPEYNFISGEREKKGKVMKVPENGLIIIEGIHGLNERLTAAIPKENKFKVYVSCLTQLNIDNHNRIATSDVREIRRIVRDSLARETAAEDTLAMWDSVRRGEEKYIFPYQEDADVLFNSNLVYELGVLKRYAIKEFIGDSIFYKY